MYLSTPKRDTIYKHLLCLIRDKALEPDGMMPTELSIAKQFGATRSDVQAVMKELQKHALISRVRGHGTRANDAASPDTVRKLLGQLSRTVGVVLPAEERAYSDPHWDQSTVQAIETTLAREGYRVSYQALRADASAEEVEDCLDALHRVPVGGMILMPNQQNRVQWLGHSALLEDSGLTICVLDMGDKDEDTWHFHKLRHNPYDEGLVLARYLQEKLERVMLVAGEGHILDRYWVRERLRGLQAGAARWGCKHLQIVEVCSIDGVVGELQRRRKKDPAMVVGLTDGVASRCLAAATENGLVCGADFELVGFDNNAFFWTSNLTTVAHQRVLDGETLACVMIDALRGRYQRGLTTVNAQPIVIERTTCQR